MTILDADGHVTETQDQIVKYLDEPYRRRPSGAFFYPWDGWDRRLLGTLIDAGSRSGLSVRDASSLLPSLETVFLELTGREYRE